MSDLQHGTLEDFDITADELGKIQEALKKKEFRDLFKTYVEEINDPENRKLYEKEIAELERERGYEVKFIHPTIGYVIKTSSDSTTKTYINVCSNPNIDPPVSEKSSKNGCGGLNWSIPYILTPLKKLYGRNNNIFHVYDAIFHPDSIHLASKNEQFREVVSNTAIEGVESNFKIKLDKTNLKFLNVKYKGANQPAVIRKKLNGVADGSKSKHEDVVSKLKFGEHTVFQSAISKNSEQSHNETSDERDAKISDYAVPKYELKHRSSVDFQDFTCNSVSKINAATPKELIVTVALPLLKSTSDTNLDISGDKLYLASETPAKYKLEIDLPYSVYENKGNAVFDKSTRVLTVTLPVSKVEENVVKAFEYLREDSGVESDRTSGTSSIEDESAFRSDEKKIVLEDDGLGSIENECAEPDCDNFESSRSCDKDIYFNFPKFTSNYADSTLVFTLHIKNTDPASVSYKPLKNNTAVLFHFYSIGLGHFPTYYSFFVDMTEPFESSTEVWDNSVIVQLALRSDCVKNIKYYYVGLNENDDNLSKLELPHPAAVAKNFSDNEDAPTSNLNDFITVTKHGSDEVTLELSAASKSEVSHVAASTKINNNVDSDDERENETEALEEVKSVPPSLDEKNNKAKQKSSRRKKRRCNSVNSEVGTETSDIPSSIDSYNFSNLESGKQRRGILKYSRSLSESDPVDFAVYPSEYSCSLPDYGAHGDNHHKNNDKRVRFSDVVSSKTFKSNVSILSQNKRKQKKQKYKKRVQERRASESETEYEIDLTSIDTNTAEAGNNKSHHNTMKIPINVNHEIDESNASVSETSGDTSDGSECNDYQTSKPPQKNSKARNRKNWQKTKGASAKLRVLNDLIFQLDDV